MCRSYLDVGCLTDWHGLTHVLLSGRGLSNGLAQADPCPPTWTWVVKRTGTGWPMCSYLDVGCQTDWHELGHHKTDWHWLGHVLLPGRGLSNGLARADPYAPTWAWVVKRTGTGWPMCSYLGVGCPTDCHGLGCQTDWHGLTHLPLPGRGLSNGLARAGLSNGLARAGPPSSRTPLIFNKVKNLLNSWAIWNVIYFGLGYVRLSKGSPKVWE